MEIRDSVDTTERDDPDASLLSVRDIYKVDPRFSALLEPDITVRGKTMLISLGTQRLGALISKTEIRLLATPTSTDLAEQVQRHLRQLLRQQQAAIQAGAAARDSEAENSSQAPFQATALEAILLSATFGLEREIGSLIRQVDEEVDTVHEASLFEEPSEGAAWVVGVRELKNGIGAARGRAKGLDHALADALEDDGALRVLQASLEASALAVPKSRRNRDRNRDAAELLIETYLGQVRAATQRLEVAAGTLGGSETFATVLLDQHRNALMKFDVVITGVTGFFVFGGMVRAERADHHRAPAECHRGRLERSPSPIALLAHVPRATVCPCSQFTAIFGMNTPAHIFEPHAMPERHAATYGVAPPFGFPLTTSLIVGLTFLKVGILTTWFYCRPRLCGGRGRADAPPAALALSAARGGAAAPQKGSRAWLQVKALLLRPLSSARNPLSVHGTPSVHVSSAREAAVGSVPRLDPVGNRITADL